MIEAIILAAGYSSRTTRYKMTLPLGKKTVVERTMDAMLTVCDWAVVVCGHNREKTAKCLSRYRRAQLVYNPDYELGMFSSVKRGVSELESDTFFIIPGDQPLVQPATLRKMLDAPGDIINPAFNGKKGHPVLFRNNCRKAILEMPEDGILRDFIHTRETRVIDVDDEGVILDIDTDADYEIVKKKSLKLHV